MQRRALYSNYTNPYYATVIAAQPAQTTVVYDYSQPINVTSTPPATSVAESTEQVFSAARDSFKAGDYSRALELTDQVLKQTPDAAVVHEFRALCLFALKRYDEAAAVDYAVLTAGPGWNWSTLVGPLSRCRHLHQPATSARSLRAVQSQLGIWRVLARLPLPGSGKQRCGRQRGFRRWSSSCPPTSSRPDSPSSTRRRPRSPRRPNQADPGRSLSRPAAPAGRSGPARRRRRQSAPGRGSRRRPVRTANGSSPSLRRHRPPVWSVAWKAQASPDVAIALTLEADGKFAWEVDTKGNKQTLNGIAGFKDNTLALLQQDGPPLVGKVTPDGANKFVFAPDGQGTSARAHVHPVSRPRQLGPGDLGRQGP